jgi:molybdenum cofactor cytidylyltransferase
MISALVLAAGLSRRMGKAKMLLPWGEKRIITRVVDVLAEAGVDEVIVVTGGHRQRVEAELEGRGVITIYNPVHAQGGMLSSLQTGLRWLIYREEQQKKGKIACQAVLICLGDQPQVNPGVVRGILSTYQATGATLVVPSCQNRRGHPWLAARNLWQEMLNLQPPQTLRDFLNQHADQIHYLEVDDPSVLGDVDTPADYSSLTVPGSEG